MTLVCHRIISNIKYSSLSVIDKGRIRVVKRSPTILDPNRIRVWKKSILGEGRLRVIKRPSVIDGGRIRVIKRDPNDPVTVLRYFKNLSLGAM